MDFSVEKVREVDFPTIYEWKSREKNHELFTCRPVKRLGSYDAFREKIIKNIDSGAMVYMVLIDKVTAKVLGEIKGFDYNPRNRSMEFGYYFPSEYRGAGFGSIAVKRFVQKMFFEENCELNKLYATTSASNSASIKLLERNGFHLDGCNREHYWIGNDRFDQLVYSILKRELAAIGTEINA